jgi:hypothetical protein
MQHPRSQEKANTMTGTTARGVFSFATINEADEQSLRALLSGDFFRLRTFPDTIETAFTDYFRANAATLLRQSIYLLACIYLLVCLPISIISTDPALGLWQAMAMVPIGIVLGFIWLSTRFSSMDNHVETTLGICLFICLSGTIACSMLLGDDYFGRISSYETIYILVIAFSILRLPTLLALRSALIAFVLALTVTLVRGLHPVWLDMLLYFGVPLIICTINGYMLEYSERRNFVQNLLINMESHRLAEMRKQAEHDAERQEKNSRFLEMIAGNLSSQEIASRALSFLIMETGAMVGATYRVDTAGNLVLVTHWGADVRRLRRRQQLAAGETLLGQALKTRQISQISNIPPDYLPIVAGSAEVRPAAILMIPVYYGDAVVAAVELGAMHAFDAAHIELANAITTHFAYALMAAMSRSDETEQIPALAELADH